MRTAQPGIDLIKSFESLRLKAYDDEGMPAIGYGHRAGVQMGDVIDVATADRMLRNDLMEFEGYLRHYCIVPLEQNRWDPCVSFIFNVGIGKVKEAGLFELLNAEKFVQVYDLIYHYSDGKLPGLVRRRHAEAAMFADPSWKLPITIKAANTFQGILIQLLRSLHVIT